MAQILPSTAAMPMADYTIEGVSTAGWKMQFAPFTLNDGAYFRAMGIPLREGRYFTSRDNGNAPLVLIVNESMAGHAWPGQDPLGKRVHLGNPEYRIPYTPPSSSAWPIRWAVEAGPAPTSSTCP